MKKALLFVLTLSELTALATSLKEYHYVRKNMTWSQAREYCRDTFTDLASVKSVHEQKQLQSVLQDYELEEGARYAWLGLYDDLTSWRWLYKNQHHNPNKHFNGWKSRKPENRLFHDGCTVMSEEGLWHDVPCSTKHPVVCYYEPGPSNYILVQRNLSWNQAGRYCRHNYTSVVTVAKMSVNNNVSSLLSVPSWIGLYRKPWAMWSDGSARHFNKWDAGMPRNTDSRLKCAVVRIGTGKWFGADCDRERFFVCHKIVPPASLVQHKSTFEMQFQSEADLEDPGAQQQILEQLHSKLEKQGIKDFKLRWVKTPSRQTCQKDQEGEKDKGCGG